MRTIDVKLTSDHILWAIVREGTAKIHVASYDLMTEEPEKVIRRVKSLAKKNGISNVWLPLINRVCYCSS